MGQRGESLIGQPAPGDQNGSDRHAVHHREGGHGVTPRRENIWSQADRHSEANRLGSKCSLEQLEEPSTVLGNVILDDEDIGRV